MKTKPLWKNGVLVYIGDTEFFRNSISNGLYVPEETINRAISTCVTGVVVAKGSEAFKNADFNVEIGNKLAFNGYFGNIFSEKAEPTEKTPNNRAYYRIMKDEDFVGFVELNQNIELL